MKIIINGWVFVVGEKCVAESAFLRTRMNGMWKDEQRKSITIAHPTRVIERGDIFSALMFADGGSITTSNPVIFLFILEYLMCEERIHEFMSWVVENEDRYCHADLIIYYIECLKYGVCRHHNTFLHMSIDEMTRYVLEGYRVGDMIRWERPDMMLELFSLPEVVAEVRKFEKVVRKDVTTGSTDTAISEGDYPEEERKRFEKRKEREEKWVAKKGDKYFASSLDETYLTPGETITTWTHILASRCRYITGDDVIVTEDEAHSNLHAFTEGMLEGIDWHNVVLAGGSLSLILSTKLQQWKDGKYLSSDADLFIYGDTNKQRRDKIKELMEHFKSRYGKDNVHFFSHDVMCVMIMLVRGKKRTIQFVDSGRTSPQSILMGFDMDITQVAYDGNAFLCLPGFIRAMETQVVSCRRIDSYKRLAKYLKRGFSIRVNRYLNLFTMMTSWDTIRSFNSYLHITTESRNRVTMLAQGIFQEYIRCYEVGYRYRDKVHGAYGGFSEARSVNISGNPATRIDRIVAIVEGEGTELQCYERIILLDVITCRNNGQCYAVMSDCHEAMIRDYLSRLSLACDKVPSYETLFPDGRQIIHSDNRYSTHSYATNDIRFAITIAENFESDDETEGAEPRPGIVQRTGIDTRVEIIGWRIHDETME